jgi:hypothetical protein
MSMAPASSAYFRIPKFSQGDLEEVMQTFRPQEYCPVPRLIPRVDHCLSRVR